MTILRSEGAGETSGDFYGGVATQSLRFDIASTSYLKRQPSASNRKTYVLSFWLKPSKATLNSSFLAARTGSGGTYTNLCFSASDNRIRVVDNQTSYPALETNAKYRDLSAWYHIVFAVDTTQTTNSNKLKVYVNGTEQTYATSYYYSTNDDTNINSTDDHYIGYQAGVANLDGYLAEYNFIDGLSFFSDTSGTANSSFNINSFGETKNGVWIPKAYSGSYGSNGFRLAFNSTDFNTSSSSTMTDPHGSGTAVPANGLADASGQGNHWTTNGIGAIDFVSDSPENNFCTLSGLFLPSNTNNQILEGALVADATAGSWSHVPATWAWLSGKWYWEISAANTAMYAGAVSPTVANDSANALFGWDNPLRDAWLYHPSGLIRYNGSNQATGKASFSANDILAFAVDISGQTLRFYVNNSLQYTASHDFTGWYPAVATINTVYARFNFGQDGSFSGLFSGGDIGTQTDENGHGAFKYAPPTGYLAMCTANLAEPTIGPNSDTNTTDHFDTLDYVGNSASDGSGTTQNITGLDFKPDWIWVKNKDTAADHRTVDSSRGEQKTLYISGYYSENEGSDGTTGITGFTAASSAGAGGFVLGSHTGFNKQNDDFIAWNWKANGGTTSSDGNGSITSTVQVNSTAKFSIVTFTGNNTNDATIGHGLGTAPEWIITKNRDDSQVGGVDVHWRVFHKNLTNDGTGQHTEFISRNLYEVEPAGHSNGYIKTVGSNTYSTHAANVDSNAVNGSGDKMIAYCHVGVEGYSKFGTFTGNGSTDGTFVYLGFRPQLIIAKCISHSSAWHMADTNLDVNPVGYLNADATDTYQDYNHYDLLSNGFKVRDNGTESNRDGGTFIYMAWAETPFKYANAR